MDNGTNHLGERIGGSNDVSGESNMQANIVTPQLRNRIKESLKYRHPCLSDGEIEEILNWTSAQPIALSLCLCNELGINLNENVDTSNNIEDSDNTMNSSSNVADSETANSSSGSGIQQTTGPTKFNSPKPSSSKKRSNQDEMRWHKLISSDDEDSQDRQNMTIEGNSLSGAETHQTSGSTKSNFPDASFPKVSLTQAKTLKDKKTNVSRGSEDKRTTTGPAKHNFQNRSSMKISLDQDGLNFLSSNDIDSQDENIKIENFDRLANSMDAPNLDLHKENPVANDDSDDEIQILCIKKLELPVVINIIDSDEEQGQNVFEKGQENENIPDTELIKPLVNKKTKVEHSESSPDEEILLGNSGVSQDYFPSVEKGGHNLQSVPPVNYREMITPNDDNETIVKQCSVKLIPIRESSRGEQASLILEIGSDVQRTINSDSASTSAQSGSRIQENTGQHEAKSPKPCSSKGNSNQDKSTGN